MSRNSQRLLILLSCIFVGCSAFALAKQLPTQSAGPASNLEENSEVANAAPAPLYTVQPNDVLEIFVWKEPELSRKVLVRPDGRISFPLIQDMPAAGLTPEQLKGQIEYQLKTYISVPNVTVIVDAIQSYRVFVTGKVTKPGAISAEKPMTVIQALALAGGYQEYANPAEMVVIRNTGMGNVLFRFNYFDVIKGKNFNQNMLLRTGDVIVVP